MKKSFKYSSLYCIIQMNKVFDDKQAVEAARKDSSKFAVLYDQYFDQIYRYVFRRVGEVENVQDIVSQTFFDALRHIGSYEDRGFPFSSWLYKIAHNNVLKWYRTNSRSSKVDLEEVAEIRSDENVEKEVDIQLDKSMLLQALGAMDEEQQELIRLKYFEEVSNMEIAEIMGISANNVGVKLFRALKKLKQFVENEQN